MSNAYLLILAIYVIATLSACVHSSVPANVILDWAHHSNGTAVAFNRTSDTLASTGSDGRIRLWRLPNGQGLHGWKAHSGSVHGLLFLTDNSLLSSGYDGVLARWHADGTLNLLQKTPAPIFDLVIDETANLAVTGHVDGFVRQWRLSNLSLQREMHLHSGRIRAIALHPASGMFASSGSDGQVYIWNANEPPRRLAPPPTDAHDLAFAPDGRYLIGSGWFRLFRWRVADGALEVLPTEHHGLIVSIQYNNDGSTLATISRQTDSAVDFLDPKTGVVLQRFQPHDLCGAFIRFSPDGRYLASTSDDASVRIWDLFHLLPKRMFHNPQSTVSF